MRYQPEHKAEVHRKILKDASRRVRTEGITGAAVTAVMRDAGLTHGGFYKHFGSKDELLMESVGLAFQEMSERLAQAAHSRPGTAWKTIVKTYLSLEHCDHAECGCPVAALAPELARANKSMKAAIVGNVNDYRARMIPLMPGRTGRERERAFVAIFSTMVGAIAIARMLPDRAGRAKVLEDAREFLLGSPQFAVPGSRKMKKQKAHR